MPIRQSEILEWEEDESEIRGGGITNWLSTTKHPDEMVAYCARKRRVQNYKGDNPTNEPLYCSRPAGWGTVHLGYGACKVHAGNARKPIINGNASIVTNSMLKNKIEEYLTVDKKELVDISFEMATLKAILNQMVDNFEDADPDDMTAFRADASRVQSLISTISTTAEKINRIESRSALTVGQIMYLKARIEYILTKYIKDPRDRTNAFKELQSSIPAGELDEGEND